MKVGRDPGRVVKRAGLNERDRAVCQAMAVNVRAAVATEEPVERLAARAAMILVAAWTAASLARNSGEVMRQMGHYGPKHGKGSSELGWRERQLQCPFRVNRAIFAMSVASPLCPNIYRESGHPG
jgi:hypothetical protein